MYKNVRQKNRQPGEACLLKQRRPELAHPKHLLRQRVQHLLRNGWVLLDQLVDLRGLLPSTKTVITERQQVKRLGLRKVPPRKPTADSVWATTANLTLAALSPQRHSYHTKPHQHPQTTMRVLSVHNVSNPVNLCTHAPINGEPHGRHMYQYGRYL